MLEVEVVCSDPIEHSRRVEGRKADIEGFTMPTWEDVLRHDYQAWTTPRLVIDSALIGTSDAASLILKRLDRRSPAA